MSLCIALLDEMHIVGTYYIYVEFASHSHQMLIHLALYRICLVVSVLDGRTMELQLDVVILTKEVLEPQSRLLGFLQSPLLYKLR